MSTSISAYSQHIGAYPCCDNKCLRGTAKLSEKNRDNRATFFSQTDVSRPYSFKSSLDTFSSSPLLSRLNHYPTGTYRTYPRFYSTMSNVQNITQRQAKGSVGINTSYRDSYRPWYKSNDASTDGLNGTISSCKPQRSIRESSISASNIGLSNVSTTAKPVTSRYLATQSSYDRTPAAELADLSLGDNPPDKVTAGSLGSSDTGTVFSRAATTHLPLSAVTSSHTTFYSTPTTSAAHAGDKSPTLTHPGCRSPSPESVGTVDVVSPAIGTSNSSNNSSAPRWSTMNAHTNYVSKSRLIGDQRQYRNGGTVGLNNLGNTCFMNSIIQCLSNTSPLLEYCLTDRYQDELNKSSTMRGNLFASYATLMKELWEPDARDSSVSPHQFKTQIQRFAPRFVGYSQQDAQEFLRYVLEGLHVEVNRVTKRPHPVVPDYAAEDRLSDRDKADVYWKRYLSMDNSEIVDLFVGQLMSTLECTECGFKSTCFDPFWDLSLPIPKKTSVSIMDCLRLFTSKEDLDGNERPVCGRCKVRRRCTKSFSIQKFPRILVLHLKRFSGERFRSKMSLLVDYPINDLNVVEFASPSCPQRSARYNLYAVSNHSGSVYAGHYTATCRHPYTGSWYDFNDSRVRPTSAQTAVSPEGYVLFYEMIDSGF